MLRKVVTITLALLVLLGLSACGSRQSFEIGITIPAGSREAFVYSDEEISPLGDTITISAGEGITDTEVILEPVEVREENAYEPAYLTAGMPVQMEVERGAWFRIGVALQNPTDTDITVWVVVEGVEVRIE